MLTLWPNWWEDWQLYHKVTFDGLNRRIIINEGETVISVKADIYSSWKEWLRLRDNTKFMPALRTIGGDSIGSGKRAGDMYFLMNGWRVVVNKAVQVDGALFHDDGLPVFIVNDGGSVTSTVSNLVQTMEVPVPVVTGDISTVVNAIPTANQIADSVWNKPVPASPQSGSFGEFTTKKLLTKRSFIALK